MFGTWSRRLFALVILIGRWSLPAAIRPSLNVSACSWNASDILVMAPTHERGEFRVIEAIKGDTPLGTVLMLEGLALPDGVTSPLAELAARVQLFRALE